MRRERGLQELHRGDPGRADAVVLGRRGALKRAGLAAVAGALGAAIPFGGSCRRATCRSPWPRTRG
jgi:hypothetical protein